ncbi:MAG TPA: DinB family protein [Ktedonobacteraceae bacterium]|nr:DinB family protein [Ktedonobacteraceae bacterium]
MTTVERPFDRVRQKMVTARIELMAQLARFSASELTQSVAENEWSPLQIAHHLYIVDGLALEQMKRVQDEDNPLIIPLEEEGPRQTNHAELPASLDVVLAGMAARREDTFTYLADLPDQAWERPCQHKTWGQMKFYQLVNVLPKHDQGHAAQLSKLKARIEHDA